MEHREHDQISVMALESWPVRTQLDSHVGEFRKLLDVCVQHWKDLDAAPAAQDVEFKPDIPDVPSASLVISYHDANG